MSSPNIPTHMPAMKVGGRRLSVNNRHHRSGSTSKDAAKAADPATPPEYPRPKAEEGEEGEEVQAEPTEEQEEQKDEEAKKKQANFTPDHVKRDGKWTDGRAPKKNTFGGAGRISQPAGKGFAS